jgi:hypothetical protein
MPKNGNILVVAKIVQKCGHAFHYFQRAKVRSGELLTLLAIKKCSAKYKSRRVLDGSEVGGANWCCKRFMYRGKTR